MRSGRVSPAPRFAALAFGLASSSLFLGGCDLAGLLNDLLGVGNLTGQNAFVYLQPDTARGSATNVNAVFQVVEWQAEGTSSISSTDRFSPDPEVLGLMQGTARTRNGLRSENFRLFNFTSFMPEGMPVQKAVFDPINLGALRNEYVVPNLNAIPVRNQGQRGTCAAFAGIGHIEYAVLRANPSLGTVDLSEQRFYYTSKPECQSSGCREADAGSWYGTGMEASMRGSSLDIPLERDCPYNPNPGNNELQVPQAGTCSNGAVRVRTLEYVLQPREIIRVLEEDGLPVPFASPLSNNYFSNNGLITQRAAGSAGNAFHAAGHAYLIVGYKLLPNMPEEGGMCFLIKNSWGTGWGASGYSCITLAWMQEWNYGMPLDHPIVVDLELRDDLASGANDDAPPDFIDGDTQDDETIDYDRLDDDTPVPNPPPNELTWTAGWVRGPDDRFYRVETAEPNGSELAIRGLLRGQSTPTGIVRVQRQGNRLYFDGDEVGTFSGNDLVLCTAAYDPICALRFEPARNDLYIEFLFPESRKVRDDELPQGQWTSLVPLPINLDLQFYRPSNAVDALFSPVFVRGARTDGSILEPLRLTLNQDLDIRAMGQPVGSVRPASPGLCTGDYQTNCSLFGGPNGLVVLPGWGVRR